MAKRPAITNRHKSAWLAHRTPAIVSDDHHALPAGMIAPYAGASAPSGWLLCDGAAVSRTTYANLFAAISTAYGAGNGSTTFNVPNLQGKFPKGKSADALGDTGGAAMHTHAGHTNHVVTQPSAHASHTHTGPSHQHGVTGGPTVDNESAHTHGVGTLAFSHTHNAHTTDDTGSSGASRLSGPTTHDAGATNAQGTGATGAGSAHAHSLSGSVDAGGTGATGNESASLMHSDTAVDAHSAHDTPNSEPPYLVVNYIIKT